jgi:hypothetical protein
MTPKEKAEELVLKYLKMKRHKMFNGWWHKIISKQCALIAVDEIISAIDWHEFETPNKELIYWQQVKHEIQKL